jgi:hypothetical protein
MHRLVAVSSVRCLGCGTAYPKPAGGGTAESNPGCPKCGYVGWLPDDERFRGEFAPRRSAAGPPPLRFWKAG